MGRWRYRVRRCLKDRGDVRIVWPLVVIGFCGCDKGTADFRNPREKITAPRVPRRLLMDPPPKQKPTTSYGRWCSSDRTA
jgi:hypothetical protein